MNPRPMGAMDAIRRKVMFHNIPPHNDFPHIFVRCAQCTSSLPPTALDNAVIEKLGSSQKPVLNGCPQCKRPFPRCYVCQLSLVRIKDSLRSSSH